MREREAEVNTRKELAEAEEALSAAENRQHSLGTSTGGGVPRSGSGEASEGGEEGDGDEAMISAARQVVEQASAVDVHE